MEVTIWLMNFVPSVIQTIFAATSTWTNIIIVSLFTHEGILLVNGKWNPISTKGRVNIISVSFLEFVPLRDLGGNRIIIKL